MNGITILSEYTYRGKSTSECIIICCIFIILLVSIIMVCYKEYAFYKEYKCTTFSKETVFTLAIALFLIFACAIVCINEYNTFYTNYSVIIDDSVGFNEFHENYEIVSKNCDVYTVREINNE